VSAPDDLPTDPSDEPPDHASDRDRPHPHLRLHRDGLVLTVTLDNVPRRNAQTPSLWRALASVAASLDPAVRVVVLRGNGPSFSAGLDRGLLSADGVEGEPDLLALGAAGAEAAEAMIAEFQQGFARWGEVPAVVVASVQGHAIGAGLQLALAADLRVVADDVQLAMRETSLGLVPDLAGTQPLVSLVGLGRALEICATGRFVGAAEAVAIGLANVAVPAADLEAATRDLVAALLSAPNAALRELKPLLRAAVGADPGSQLQRERQAQARLLRALAASAVSGRGEDGNAGG
jgi:enoyl-CoA hydratase/carnithine racemase